MGQSDAELLRAALLRAARDGEAVPGETDQYGARYPVDFLMSHGDREATVRSAWIIPRGRIGSAAHQLFCTVGGRNAVRELELLSVVALLENVADHDLLRGQVATVVERLSPGVYEVEFIDDDGRTYATLSLRTDLAQDCHFNLMRVDHHAFAWLATTRGRSAPVVAADDRPPQNRLGAHQTAATAAR